MNDLTEPSRYRFSDAEKQYLLTAEVYGMGRCNRVTDTIVGCFTLLDGNSVVYPFHAILWTDHAIP